MSAFPRFPSPPPTYDAHSSTTPASSSTLKPYLVLPHLLSLTWLAYPILSIVFVAFRLQISLASSQDAVASAKDGLLASCKAAERAATSTASIPRYMAIATNEQFADAVNGTLRAARATLILALTIMEVVINFIIDIYRSTFLCFLELIVRGALALLIGAVEEISKAVSAVADGLRSTLQASISGANSVIQSAIDGINRVNPFNDITVPSIPIPDLSGLENVQLPSDFQEALTRLNASIPTVAELKDKVQDVVGTPFELLKKDINDTFSAISFNSSAMPVPQQNSVNFCSDLDLSIVDDLGRDLIRIVKIGVIVLILIALLLIALNCFLEWFKWRSMLLNLQYTRQAWVSDPTLYHSSPPQSTAAPTVTLSDHNLLMLQGNMSHPLLTRIANNMSAKLRLSQTQHIHLQWFFHYIFHPPAFACFLIGFIGIMAIQIQLFAISAIETKYSNAAASTTSDFSNTIATSINASMYDQSAAYAASVNLRVDGIQTTVNDGLFGWVNVTTTELNTTIVNFYAGVEDAVQTVFNGTLLETPANEFLRCILGTKVDAIENALTFLNQNLRIDLPRMNDSALVLSEDSVNEAARPIALAAIGGSEDGSPNSDNRGIFGKLIDSYADGLRKERIMFAIFLGLWGFVVLMALCIIWWHSYGRAIVERRGRRRWQQEQRTGFDRIVLPSQFNNEKGGASTQPTNQLPDFTPIPSPRPPGVFSPSPRGSSPAGNNKGDKDVEKSWDSFFGDVRQDSGLRGMVNAFASRTRTRTISAPKKLMAISKKAISKPSPLKGDVDEQTQDSSFTNRIRSFGGFLSKTPQSTMGASGSPTRSRHKPNLTISVDRASLMKPEVSVEKEAPAPKSAWSISPTTPPQTSATSPKLGHITTPSVASIQLRPSLPWTRNIASPPLMPLRVMNPSPRSSSNGSVRSDAPRPRHTVNVPSDVTAASVHDALGSHQPTVVSPGLAPPLHYGYGRFGIDSRYPPIQPGLKPPVDKHRRSLSVPLIVTPVEDKNPFADSTPVTRFLSTTHARQSSSVNPFEGKNPFEGGTPSPSSEFAGNPFDRSPVPSMNPFITPFDDEHRVQISHTKPADLRKSIPTNPFGAVAL